MSDALVPADAQAADTRASMASLLRGKDTFRMDGAAVFDKVINLRLNRLDHSYFIIRSDYEPVYGPGGSVSIKRCLQKPHIKVSYEQVPGDTVIKCNIEVTNLFMDPRVEGQTEVSSIGEGETATYDKKNENKSIFEENGNPVTSITLQMGYINQFPDWSNPQAHNRPSKLRRFFALDNHMFDNDPRVGTAVELRHLLVLSTQSKGLPPDRVTLFECVVGTLHTGMTWQHSMSDLLNGYGDITFPTEDMSPVERVLFMLITRRFPSANLVYDFTPGTSVLKVYQPYKTSLGETLFGDATIDNPGRVYLDPGGCLSPEDALVFGVQCFVSEKLRSTSVNTSDPFIRSFMTADTRVVVESAMEGAQQDHLINQLEAIERLSPNIRWYMFTNGDFFFYDVDEEAEDLFNDIEVKMRQRKQIVTLPAIYDMTVDGLRQVRAPFHGFINPLTTVLVNARYNLGTMVGFFYPKQRHFWLMVITQKVEFSTTGDENMMELSCIDVDPGSAPSYDPDTGKITIESGELARKMQERFKKFDFTIENKEVYYTTGARSLEYFAKIMVYSAKSKWLANKWALAGKVPTIPLAIKVLLERNKDLLDTQARRDRGMSPEYETYKHQFEELGVTFVPYIYEDFEGKRDVIKYRIPWDPDDDGTLGAVEAAT
jgi:hypothetical protein